MKTLGSILILCIAFSFGNAQDVTVNSDFDQNADFSRYKTFSLVDRDDASTSDAKWKKDKHKDRADAETSGTGYGEQQATGATGSPGVTGDTRDRDQDMTRDQGVTDQGMTDRDRAADADDEGMGQHANRDAMGAKDKSHAKKGKDHVKKAIKAEMESRGFTYTEDSPDLLVNFSVFDGESGFTMGQDQNAYSVWGPAVGQTDQVNIEEGTIVLHLVDTESNQLVYQAYASGAADDQGQIQDEDKIREVVSQIFEESPIENNGDRR